TGSSLSSIGIICTRVLLLPQASSAGHVFGSTYSRSSHVPATPSASCVLTSLYVTVTPLQLSVAVAKPVADGSVLSSHSKVRFAGQLITGASVSSIVIICTQLLLLPHASTGVHVRVITYS